MSVLCALAVVLTAGVAVLAQEAATNATLPTATTAARVFGPRGQGEMAYELFPSNRIYCENCFGGDPADVIKYVLCDTKCGQQGITHRRLRCALACGSGTLIGTEDMYDCALLKADSLLNTPCDSLTSTVAAPTSTGKGGDDDDDGTGAVTIIIAVVVVAVVLCVVLIVAAMMFKRSKAVAPVSNVSVVVENKTVERPAKEKNKSSHKVALGIPDEGYPAEAGGTSINYPPEAGGSTFDGYATTADGYGKNAGYPPQAGESSSEDSSGPPV